METADEIFYRTIQDCGRRKAYNISVEEFKILYQLGSCPKINQSDGIAFTHELIFNGKKFMASSEHKTSFS